MLLTALSSFYVFKGIWVGVLINAIVLVFFIYLALTTYYHINSEGSMTLNCGFSKKVIRIDTITKITETSNPISAPAFSLDRLELFYGKFDSVIISPKDKQAFISAILAVHGSIEVKTKNKK